MHIKSQANDASVRGISFHDNQQDAICTLETVPNDKNLKIKFGDEYVLQVNSLGMLGIGDSSLPPLFQIDAKNEFGPSIISLTGQRQSKPAAAVRLSNNDLDSATIFYHEKVIGIHSRNDPLALTSPVLQFDLRAPEQSLKLDHQGSLLLEQVSCFNI